MGKTVHASGSLEVNRRRALAAGAFGTGTLIASALPGGSLIGDVAAAPRQDRQATVTTPSDVVQTAQGRVRGYARGGIQIFKGIPYAQTTEGAERWLPPRVAASWEGVRSSRSYGPTCPQSPRGGWRADEAAFLFQWDDGFPGEDCLRVNLWTPAINDGRRRPVLFWIHGGGFTAGSSQELPAYDGENLARRGDVVFVSVNHRIGPLGFLNLAGLAPGYEDSGNAGMLDLVAALRWVRENIAAFGGDPANVTIMGQSGGGGKVATLMSMPSAQGLFHKAVIQSGSYDPSMDAETSRRVTREVLSGLGMDKPDLPRLQAIAAPELIAAASKAIAKLPPIAGSEKEPRGPRRVGWGPVTGSTTLPEMAFAKRALPMSSQIPLMTGSTRDEFDLKRTPITDAELLKQLRATWSEKAGAIAAAAHAAFPNEPPAHLRTIIDAMALRNSAMRQLDLQHAAGNADVFSYWFSWQTPVLDRGPGAYHCQDLNFWFDNVARAENATGGGPDAQRLADTMADALIAFARVGNPSTRRLVWPRYTADSRQTAVLDTASAAVSDPAGKLRALTAPA